MVKNQNLIFCHIIVFSFIFFLLSCENNQKNSYSPVSLVKGEKPDPIKDLNKLKKMFNSFDGNLISNNDKVVRWKDTKMFRMFEFERHTVVIFPYNWGFSGFDLIIFSGRVKDYNNLFKSIRYKYKPSTQLKTDYFNDTMVFDISNPYISEIGFEGFYFGDSLETVKKKQIPRIERRWSKNSDQKKLRMSFLTAAKDHVWGTADRSKFRLFFKNGQVVYMHFWIEGFPQLGGYSIDKPVLPVIEQGKFDISKE
jgi:hypothetical protein